MIWLGHFRMRLLNLISGSNAWRKILEKRLHMKRVHIGDVYSKDEVDNKYSLSETGTTYEYGGLAMATVKEVKLMENEVMVTPVVLIDSVRNPDGTQYQSNIYTKDKVDAKITSLQNSIKEIAKKIIPKKWTIINQSAITEDEDTRAICYGNGKFVTATRNTKIAYSLDGFTWTAVANSPFRSYIYSLCYGDGKFIAGGSDGKMAYSSDGINWAAITSPFPNYDSIYALCYGNGKYVASSHGRIAYSSDGINWAAITSPFGDTSIDSICYGNGKYVAVGTHKVGYSTDIVNWTIIEVESYLHHVCYGNGKFVAVGNMFDMAYSTNGVTWTEVRNESMGGEDLDAICYGNGKFIIGGGSGGVGYSTDGVTWKEIASHIFAAIDSPNSPIRSICYGDGKFIAGSWCGRMAYSQSEFDFGF